MRFLINLYQVFIYGLNLWTEISFWYGRQIQLDKGKILPCFQELPEIICIIYTLKPPHYAHIMLEWIQLSTILIFMNNLEMLSVTVLLESINLVMFCWFIVGFQTRQSWPHAWFNLAAFWILVQLKSLSTTCLKQLEDVSYIVSHHMFPDLVNH